MTRKYRIVLEILCEVKEKVQGYGSRESLDFTQEIIDSMVSHPEVLDCYYRYRLLENLLEGMVGNHYVEELDSLKMCHVFWQKLKRVVKPEVKTYIEEKIFGKTNEVAPCGDFIVDLNSDLLVKQLEYYGLAGLSLEALTSFKEEDKVVLVKLINLEPDEPFQVENFPVARCQ